MRGGEGDITRRDHEFNIIVAVEVAVRRPECREGQPARFSAEPLEAARSESSSER